MQLRPSELDREFWELRGVDVLDVPLDEYVACTRRGARRAAGRARRARDRDGSSARPPLRTRAWRATRRRTRRTSSAATATRSSWSRTCSRRDYAPLRGERRRKELAPARGRAPRLRAVGDLVPVLFSDWRGDAAASLAAALREGVRPRPAISSTRSSPPRSQRAPSARRRRPGRRSSTSSRSTSSTTPTRTAGDSVRARVRRAVIARADLPVSFLISIREDALARLERFKGRMPGVFDTYLRLDRLGRDAAREAIVAPLALHAALTRTTRSSAEPVLVEQVLDEVEVGRVAFGGTGAGAGRRRDRNGPARTRRSRRRISSSSWLASGTRSAVRARSVLRLETLERLGGAERIVRTHLDDALGAPRSRRAGDRGGRVPLPRDAVGNEDRAPGRRPRRVRRLLRRRPSRRCSRDSPQVTYVSCAPSARTPTRSITMCSPRPCSTGGHGTCTQRELAAAERRRRSRWRLALAALVARDRRRRGRRDSRSGASRPAGRTTRSGGSEAQALEAARALPYARSVYAGHARRRTERGVLTRRPPCGERGPARRRADLEARRATRSRALHLGGELRQADFSPDGALVVAASDKGEAIVWRWRSGQKVATLTEPYCLDGAAFGSQRATGGVTRRRRDDPALGLAIRPRRRDPRWPRWRRYGRRLEPRRAAVRRRAATTATCACGTGDAGASSPRWLRAAAASTRSRSARRPLRRGRQRGCARPSVGLAGAPARVVAQGRFQPRRGVQPGRNDHRQRRHPRGTCSSPTGGTVTRCARLREGGAATVTFSPDGCLVASSGYDHWARVWAPPLHGCRR